jgi:hypothetical protein
MKSLPMNMKTSPNPMIKVKLAGLVMTKKKASLAAAQKFLPVMAI